jgi:flavin-dependent dehydrogenase
MSELQDEPGIATADPVGHVPRSRHVDVVVLGGGPAGTAAAITLVRSGHAVTVLERTSYEGFRIGETFPPEVRTPLVELGIWEQFLGDRHLQSPGVAVAWGRAGLNHNDYIVNPYGPGWHVHRQRFDAMLARAAADAGVEILKGTRPTACTSDGPTTWAIAARDRDRIIVRHSSFLIDATGRAASPARRLGGGRVIYDRLAGLVAVAGDQLPPDRRTMIEATPCGWWYSTPLPDERCLGAFMTDADLLPRTVGERIRFWQAQLRAAAHTSARLRSGTSEPIVRLVSACTSRRRRVTGAGWLAAGEAAVCFDPLSQQGVTWALCSGIEAGRAVAASLRGHAAALRDYTGWVADGFAGYMRTRSHYYDLERRWTGSAFWGRRHAGDGMLKHGVLNAGG